MYAFYNTSTGIIVGGTGYGAPRNDAGITRIPDGADAFVWLDEVYWADVVNNLGNYVIQNGSPVTRVFTPAEIQAQQNAQRQSIYDKYAPQIATAREKLRAAIDDQKPQLTIDKYRNSVKTLVANQTNEIMGVQ